jgi:ATP/maltotriose-dependent transcriptional regulator MalT/DNA-binding SARP family transcriptional activator
LARTATAGSPKIVRPRLFGVVARERLFARIASADAPVVWISGAPGSGKSTLAASYLERAGRPEIWYHVDPGDVDPAAFFYYVRGAIERVGGARAGRLPLLPADAIGDLGAFARRYFRTLFARLPRETVLVLDGFQDAEGSPFETVVREAFEEVPDGFSVIVLSLADPPAGLARLLANGRIARIGDEELRLTREESDRLVLARIRLDTDALAGLHERSAGWAAGLVLMTEYLRRARPGETPLLAASQSAVFDYFAGEILARATAEDQRALMLSASLPRVTSTLVEAMSAHRDARRLLEYLSRRHLFVDRGDGREPTYRYHGLFAAFLRAQARERLASSEITEGCERAALLLELQGEVEDAIGMYLAAAHWKAASRLIEQHARTLYQQGRWRTLLDWIQAVPTEVFATQPWLAYWVGACQVWVNPPFARSILEAAYQGFEVRADHDGQVLAAGALTRACILDADWRPLDRWIAALQALLTIPGITPHALTIGYSRLLYAALVRQPQNPGQRQWAERARGALAADIDPSERVLAAFSLLAYYTWTGQTAGQDEIVRYVEPILGDVRASSVSLAYWQWAYSTHLLRTGAPAKALDAIDRALELAIGNGLAIAGVIRRHRVSHLLMVGRLDEAETELAQLANAPRIEPYHELRAWLALRRGDFGPAIDEAEEALRMATERGRTLYRMLDLALLAQIHAQSGSDAEALENLRAYRSLVAGVPGDIAGYVADLVEAYVSLNERDVPTCRRLLRRALETGSRNRYHSHWGWNAPMMTRLLTEAFESGICLPYASELVRTHRLLPESPDVPDWPWPLVIRTLGRFEILIDGSPLHFEGKVQRKPLELLKVILALGPAGASIEQLIDVLWPGAGDGDERKTFDITLHRLRKLLGAEGLLKVSDRHVSLDQRIVFVDAWAVDRMLEALVPASAALPAIERLEAAAPRILELYGGTFLAGDPDAAWKVALGNRLSGRFQRFVLRLGEHLEFRRDWRQAEELYQRAIELDALAESFYRRQMICLRAQGRRAEALAVFRRCRQILSITLGVPPGADTQAVYRELMAG